MSSDKKLQPADRNLRCLGKGGPRRRLTTPLVKGFCSKICDASAGRRKYIPPTGLSPSSLPQRIPMTPATPRYVLVSRTRHRGTDGQWHFTLRSTDGRREMNAADYEPGVQGQRLELLSVVRGLEALEEPSRVTLVTESRYVRRGLSYGLAEWRENEWRWERFGQLVPVKHRDLWQRIDRALKFHEVECRTWRFDPPQNPANPVHVREPGLARPKPTQPVAATAEIATPEISGEPVALVRPGPAELAASRSNAAGERSEPSEGRRPGRSRQSWRRSMVGGLAVFRRAIGHAAAAARA